MKHSLRITRKLRWACDVLSDERLGDCDPNDFVRALKAGAITDHQVYAAMAGLHRRWSPVSDYWVLNTTGRTVRLLHQLYHIAEKFEVEPGDE